MVRLDPGAVVVSWKVCIRNGGLSCARTEGRDTCSLLGVKEKHSSDSLSLCMYSCVTDKLWLLLFDIAELFLLHGSMTEDRSVQESKLLATVVLKMM